jgi:hypothetical protein
MASLFYCRASAAGEVFSQVVQGWEGGTNFSTSQFPRERYLEVPASSPSGLHEQDPRQDMQLSKKHYNDKRSSINCIVRKKIE